MDIKKTIRILFVVVVLFVASYTTNIYALKVTASNETISAYDIHGNDVTLTRCTSENGKNILLENVTPGKTYTAIIDTCDTFNTEDDNILIVF